MSLYMLSHMTCPPQPTSFHPSTNARAATFKVQVTGNNIEVTPAMRDYVQKKLGKVRTFLIRSLNVHFVHG